MMMMTPIKKGDERKDLSLCKTFLSLQLQNQHCTDAAQMANSQPGEKQQQDHSSNHNNLTDRTFSAHFDSHNLAKLLAGAIAIHTSNGHSSDKCTQR